MLHLKNITVSSFSRQRYYCATIVKLSSAIEFLVLTSFTFRVNIFLKIPNFCFIGHLIGARINKDLVMGGLFIVRQDMRSQGIGKALFDERANYVGDSNFGISIGSTRLQTHQKLYTARHFAFEIIGYSGPRGSLLESTDKYRIVPIVKVDFGNVSKYDTKVCTIFKVSLLSWPCQQRTLCRDPIFSLLRLCQDQLCVHGQVAWQESIIKVNNYSQKISYLPLRGF